MKPFTKIAPEAYLQELVSHGYLIETGVDGLFGRSGTFEKIVDALNNEISRLGKDDGHEVMRFPPAVSRKHFEESEYLKSFPQLAGTVHSFSGNDKDHFALLEKLEKGHDWTEWQKPTDAVMTPAACYPIYPTLAKRGPLAKDGARVDVYSYCFRHEPSKDPARMQLFRMREYVRIGSSEQVMQFRELWLERGQKFVNALELPLKVDVANDPFFGRAGRMLSGNQREQKLKFELLIPITSEENLTACLSFNYHQDHFGLLWKIQTATNETAHTACVGFGMERLTLALLRHHGFELEKWPANVKKVLWP